VVLTVIDHWLLLLSRYVLPKMHSVSLEQAMADPLSVYPAGGPPGGEGRETCRHPEGGEFLAGELEETEPPPLAPPVCTEAELEHDTRNKLILSTTAIRGTLIRPLPNCTAPYCLI